MDKDDYYRILEDISCSNMENYFVDSEWTLQSQLSNVIRKEDFLNKADTAYEETKESIKEKNAIKYYHSALDETLFYDKIIRENDNRKVENAWRNSCESHKNLDEFYERKNELFEKILISHSTNRPRYNKLNFHNNINLEKYSIGQSFQDTCPGLKPSSNWPVSLDDLLTRLSSVTCEELFHQPFDVSGEFHNDALSFIRKYFNELNSTGEKMLFQIYEEYLVKSILALLMIKIMEGNFTRFYEVLSVLDEFHRSNSELFQIIFHKMINFKVGSLSDSIFKTKINELLEMINENKFELYPIMRNYSINDCFNISKNILFAFTRNSFSMSTSVTTDSKFLYVLLVGINGGMMKIGTGYQNTLKGKVYISVKNDSKFDEFSHQWVYVKGKLYLKSSISNGYLTIINPENLQIEGKIKLLFPEAAKHQVIRKKNDNYILMTDGENINILILEPVLKDEKINEQISNDENEEDEEKLLLRSSLPKENTNPNTNSFKKSKNANVKTVEQVVPTDIFTYVNLVLYTFSINSSNHETNRSQNINTSTCINEIYEAFSFLFTKEECKKALILNNWNISKTAMYLVDNEKEIKQPLLIPENVCLLFQTKIDSTYYKNSRTDFKIIKNSIFDTTQYDLLKWSICKDNVMGYKLKEGACVLFSRHSSDVKEFKYNYSVNSFTPSLNPYINNSQMFPPGFEEILIDKMNCDENHYKEYLQNELEKSRRASMKIYKENYNEVKRDYMESVAFKFEIRDRPPKFESSRNYNISNYTNFIPAELRQNRPGENPFLEASNVPEASNFSKTTSFMSSKIDPENEYIKKDNTGSGFNLGKKIMNDFLIDSDSEDEIIAYDSQKRKKLNKDKLSLIKEIKSKREEILKKRKTIPVPQVPNQTNHLIPPKQPENTIQDTVHIDTVKGSFIKVLYSINLTKYDYSFCYDNLNQIYFLVSNSSLTSISILVSDTFIKKFDKMNEIIKDFNKIENANTYDIFSNDTMTFPEFQRNIIMVLINMQIKKPDLFWKYTNWNYYFNQLQDISKNRTRDYAYEYYHDYSYPLLPQLSNYSLNVKSLSVKLDKSAEYNERIIKQQLLHYDEIIKILEKHNPESEFIKPSGKNEYWGNWNSKSSYLLKYNNEMPNNIYIDNRRVFYMCIEGEAEILTIFINSLFYEIDRYNVNQNGNHCDLLRYLVLLFFWIENCNPLLLHSTKKDFYKDEIKRLHIILRQLFDIDALHNMTCRVLLAGWEFICYDIEFQLEWFYKLYQLCNSSNSVKFRCSSPNIEMNILNMQDNPISILMNKLSIQQTLNLTYNFNKINIIKKYSICLRENDEKHLNSDIAYNHNDGNIRGENLNYNQENSDSLHRDTCYSIKSSITSINPKNVMVPFHHVLFGKKISTSTDNSSLIDNTSKEKFLVKFPILNSSLDSRFGRFNIEESKNSNVTAYEYPTIDKFEKLSDEFWNFIEVNKTNGTIISFINELFLMCIGDNQNDYKDNYSFIMKNLKFARQLISNNLTQTTVFLNSIVCCIFMKIKKYPIVYSEELLEKLIELIKDLYGKNINNSIQSFSSSGRQIESEKVLEFYLGAELTPIYEELKFPGNNIIAVEIELKSCKDKLMNYDLIIVSNEHPYENLKFNTNNNFNNYGTCFLMKMNANMTKRLYLSGEEIKIISPSDLEFNKNNNGGVYNPKYFQKQSTNNFSKCNPNSNLNMNKCLLRIKCYSYSSSKISQSIINKTNDSIITLLKDIEYYISYINKTLLKSLTNEFKDLKSAPFVNEMKNGLLYYENIEEEFKLFYNTQPFSRMTENNFLNISILPLNSVNKYNLVKTYLENIHVFPMFMRNELKILLSELTINSPTADFDEIFYTKIWNKIRENVREPMIYSSIKAIPSFDKEMKFMWKIIEVIFISCLIYHWNILDDCLYDLENGTDRNNIFELIGKKLNNLLTWMSNKVKTLKDTFDHIKIYITDIIYSHNNYVEEVRQITINRILSLSLAKKEKTKELKYDVNDVKKSAVIAEASAKSKFILKKQNYKKKSNVKRLYQELPKKNKGLAQPSASSTTNKHTETLTTPDTIINTDFNSLLLNSDLAEMPVKYFTTNFSNIFFEFFSYEKYNKLKEENFLKIEADIKENYFGNSDKLKNICEINGVPFNENNLQESLKSYTNFIFKSISNYINLDHIITDEINIENILKKLSSDSPYFNIANHILERLLFILELNSTNSINGNSSINNLYTSLNKNNSVDLVNNLEFNCEENLSLTREPSGIFKSKRKYDEEESALTQSQQNLSKSIFNFLYKSNISVSSIRMDLQKAYAVMKIRALGLRNMSQFYSQNYCRMVSKIFLSTPGLICYCSEKNLLNDLNPQVDSLDTLLDYSFESFNEIVKVITGNENNMENCFNYKLNKLNLILCDINTLLKQLLNAKLTVNEYKDLFYTSTNVQTFINISIKLLFDDAIIQISRVKSEFTDTLRLVLSKLVGVNTRLTDLVICSLYKSLDCVMKENKIDMIISLLQLILYISPFMIVDRDEIYATDEKQIQLDEKLIPSTSVSTAVTISLAKKLFEVILKADNYETVNLSCKICKIILKNNKDTKSLNFNPIYDKLGRLFLFKGISCDSPVKNREKYFVVIHMNSPEIDYQFLINALYYWEERYPTCLSLYNYKEFSNVLNNELTQDEMIKNIGIQSHPNISVNNNINNSGQKIKMFNYFNPLKAKNTKMNLLEKIADERISNLKKAIEEGNKLLNAKSASTLSNENLVSIKDRILKLKQQEAYQIRIKEHIRIAELIGETACTRGFVCLEPAMNKQIAEELAEVIHKAFNYLLPHFKANIDETVNLFNDDLIYPKMPEKELLLPGCTNTLKETTASFMNVSIFEENVYERLHLNFKFFTEAVKKAAKNVVEDKKTKLGVYNNNYLLGYSWNVISSVNYNDPLLSRVIDSNCISGKSISMIIDDIISLIYSIYDNEERINDLIVMVKKELNTSKLNKDSWNGSNSNSHQIIGLLLIVSGFYKVLRNNSKAIFNKNPDDVCKILQGGHKSGKNHSFVIFMKEKKAKIERVLNSDLQKLKLNQNIIYLISMKDLIEAFNNAYDIFIDNKESIANRILLHLIIKILTEKNMCESSDNILNLLSSEKDDYSSLFRIKVNKFVDSLKILSNETLWLEKEETIWESEFIDSFERIYNRMDPNAEKIYAPVFDIKNLEYNSQNYKVKQNLQIQNDLITKYQLPESNYTKQLPKITDLSKCTTALKNIQNFDRYVVGEIFNYCNKQYRDDEYINAFLQIRNYLSNGMISAAREDINTIFDGNKTPSHMPLPREYYDNKEISKEECYPGNYYLAKLSYKFIRESRIKSLIKQGGIAINEIPVLLILHDNTINQALVQYNDFEYGKIYTFWIAIDNLTFLESQIKIPANGFKMSELIKEYKYLEKRLRISYSKTLLSNLMYDLASKQKINTFTELLNFVTLSNWQTHRVNPISGPFHNFKNYISVSENAHITCNDYINEINTNHSQGKISLNLGKNNVNPVKHTNSKKQLEMIEINLEKILSGLSLEKNLAANEALIKWCMDNWENLEKYFIKITANLFEEYNVNYNESRNQFRIGNFSHKMLALHELKEIDSSNYSGIVLTFEKDAFLGPNAKLSFYSDPYGENLIHEVVSIKTTKTNIESVAFNFPKVWMYYTPGTRAFCIFEWYLQSRDSNLPCSIIFVPHIWPTLITLTDYCTSSLFTDINKQSLELFEKIIRKLIVHCTSLSLPADIQRRIFNLTNRAILKESKYLSLLEQQRKIKLSELSTSQKFNLIGIDEFSITQLINNINLFAVSGVSDKNFSSQYVVEGVEIILSIMSIIKESFNSLDQYLNDTFEYKLPLWIEAIIKLGQFLNFFQGSSPLEGLLMKEIYDQLVISKQFQKILIVSNICIDKNDDILLAEIKKLLVISNAKVVDFKKDVHVLEVNNNKIVVILIDGFIIDNLKKSTEEEIKEEIIEDPMWDCAYCQMENDKENTFCIFCDKPKKIKNKEKKPQITKSSLTKIDSYLYTLNDKIQSLCNRIRDSSVLSEFEVEDSIYDEKENSTKNIKIKKKNILNVLQGEEALSKNMNEYLNLYFVTRLKEYVKEGDFIKEKIKNIENNNRIKNYISTELDIIKDYVDNKPDISINFVKVYESLQNHGIDFWLENVMLDSNSRNNEINIKLMEKIREFVDLKICKEKNISLVFPAIDLRFVPSTFDSINHHSIDILENNYHEIRTAPLSLVRYYWTLIKYFNNCLVAALPFIKPPDAYSKREYASDDEGYVHIPFPKTMSAFLSTARGITYSFTKQNLIKEIVAYTEFNEEEVQIPTFIFERLKIVNTLDKSSQDNNHNNITDNSHEDGYIREIKSDESLFLQAYEQAKDVDPAFFRSKKIPGDPQVGFKVEFKGELVQGIGGPYRQFFSDISAELQRKDIGRKNKKPSFLLCPTSNNSSQKGEYKDRWTINPSYNSNTALNHYEFLGILMGICIRTGVHLTLDLSSIIWKKIIDDSIIIDDIKQFDEGLSELIGLINDPALSHENFDEDMNYTIELTDGSLYEIYPDGSNKKVLYQDRFKFLDMVIKTRLNESESQIQAIKKGICKLIPESLLKLLTYKELERLVCGVNTVDLDLLKSHTKLSQDLNENTNKVKWLWEILSEVSDEERVNFVKFCWAQERLPSTHEEFQRLQIVFTIKSNIDKNRKDVFPKADTCFFHLELPEYSSKEKMKKLLLTAINFDNVSINADKSNLDGRVDHQLNSFNNMNMEDSEEDIYNY